MPATVINYRAIIEYGPQNWEIVQQRNGFAEVFLSGRWIYDESDGSEKVMIRVLSESDRKTVLPFTPCEMLDGNQWQTTLRIPAGGPYIIETVLKIKEVPDDQSNCGDMIRHFGVGDLFVIAGQSNATGFGREPVEDPPVMGVNALYADGKWDIASHPLGDSTGTIHPLNCERINASVSPWLRFAKILHIELGYPIGLIPASKGSSGLERWNPEENGDLFDNMCEIVGNRFIKAVLWYQGESDTYNGRECTYLERFIKVVDTFRKRLRNADNDILPLLTVQINHRLPVQPERDMRWEIVREAQAHAARVLPAVYMINSLGLPLTDKIHISSEGNIILGERAAKLALEVIYNK